MIVGAIFQKPIVTFDFGELSKEVNVDEFFDVWIKPAFNLNEFTLQLNAANATVVKVSNHQYRLKYATSGNHEIKASAVSRNRKTEQVSNSLTINVK